MSACDDHGAAASHGTFNEVHYWYQRTVTVAGHRLPGKQYRPEIRRCYTCAMISPRRREVRQPQDASPPRRANLRSPLNLEVRYTVLDCLPVQTGLGRTIDLCSLEVRFTADRPLTPGLRLDRDIDWPVLFKGGVQQKLTMSGVVMRTSGTETALQVFRHEFKTRRVG